MPSLLLDGAAVPILDVSQIAGLLGLPFDTPEGGHVALDLAIVLAAWCAAIDDLPLELLLRPTPSRGRTLRNLTVNVFHPIELLPSAWTDARFEWDPDGDADRETDLTTAEAIVGYAVVRLATWRRFVIDEPDLGQRDPLVASPRGAVTFSALLASQRWHAAYHYRQLLEFRRDQGIPAGSALDVARLSDLVLPIAVF